MDSDLRNIRGIFMVVMMLLTSYIVHIEWLLLIMLMRVINHEHLVLTPVI